MTLEGAFIAKVANMGTEEGTVVQKVEMVFETVRDRVHAAGHENRCFRRGEDLRLGHPGGHRIAIGDSSDPRVRCEISLLIPAA